MGKEKELIKAIKLCGEAIKFLEEHKDQCSSSAKMRECLAILEDELIVVRASKDKSNVLSGNAKIAIGCVLFILKTYFSFKD